MFHVKRRRVPISLLILWEEWGHAAACLRLVLGVGTSKIYLRCTAGLAVSGAT